MKAWIVIKKGGAQALGLDLDEARRRAVENRYVLEFDSEHGYSIEVTFDDETGSKPDLPPL